MSQADDQDPERAYGIDGRFSQSRPTPSQPSRGETNFGDSSGPLFSMYSKIAEDEDNKMVDQWQKDADGIIIFSGLFSAVLAALVVLSIQDLKQDASAFYLQKIYELQADPNVSRSFTPEKPPTFSPSQSAIWVNVLWFLSLVMSLTCAMFATTLQQWARRYLRITQPARTSPHKRARMRAFFANGVDRFRVSWAAEALPALLHLSLFLFFAGLLIYLFDINFIVFNAVLCWVAFLSLVYGCVTMMPIFWHDSPYYAPFSSTAWFLYAIILYSIFEIPLVGSFCSLLLGLPPSIEELRNVRRGWIVGGAEGAAEETALGRASEIDVRIMEWTVDALGEDDTLERFFETIPGFYRSAVVKNLRQTLPENIESKILGTLDIFLRRTLSSNSVSGSIKGHRLAIYLNTASEVRTPHGVHTMFARVIRENWPGVPHSIDIGHYLKSWDKENNGRFTLYIQCIIAQIVATVQEHSDRWTTLATGLLGVSDGVLQAYLANGESLLLANLIHITRQITLSHWRPLGILQSLSKFDIRNTFPELQHEFCTLWNEIVLEAQDSVYYRPLTILREIHHLYGALHQGTDAAPTAFSASTRTLDPVLGQPSSYPLCNIPGHRSDPTPLVHHELSTLHPPAVPFVAVLQSTDDPSLNGVPPPQIVTSPRDSQSSHSVPEMHVIDSLALPESTATNLPADPVSPTANSDTLPSASAASIPLFISTEITTDAAAPQNGADYSPVSLSPALGTPPSPSPSPVPNPSIAPSTDSQLFSSRAPSRSPVGPRAPRSRTRP